MGGSLFSLENLLTVVDVIVVATVVYWLMLLVKGARAEKMIWGLGIIVLVYFFSQRAGLLTLHWILNNFLGSIVIIIVVVFQQDIRRALMQMGRPFSSSRRLLGKEFVEELSRAVASLSADRTGALIAIERETELSEFVEGGVEMDAKASREILLSIFNPVSPIHDGAVVVRNERIALAGSILPLTKKEFSKTTGTRHRAAMGLAEETDAVVIAVSERTGEISIAMGEEVEKGFDYESLVLRLKELFVGNGTGGSWRGPFFKRA